MVVNSSHRLNPILPLFPIGVAEAGLTFPTGSIQLDMLCYRYNIFAMAVTPKDARWLLLVYRLPSSRSSQRVEIWRKLQRYGALALRSSRHVLPESAANQEKLEWLATAIRNYRGDASVVRVQGFDDLPGEQLRPRL